MCITPESGLECISENKIVFKNDTFLSIDLWLPMFISRRLPGFGDKYTLLIL